MSMTMKLKRKPTLRETLQATEKAMRFHAAMSGKPFAEEFAAPAVKERKPVQTRQMSDANELEAAVMREVATVIAKHPKVLFAVRQNSGGAYDQHGVPIFFYRWLRLNGHDMTLTDVWGVTTTGKPFAIEAKRRSWTKVTGQREEKQREFIEVVKSVGGIGGFVTSGEQAMEILDGA